MNQERHKHNVGFIGVGKRAKAFYLDIFKRLDTNFNICGFTKRTPNGAELIESTYGIKYFSSVESLVEQTNPDILVLPVPFQQTSSIIEKLKGFKGVIIVDTPVNFSVNEEQNVLAAEQWPFLPIEQFKKLVINNGVLGDIIYAENDGRTFNYHGISQLRSYFNYQKEIKGISGSSISSGPEVWHFGNVKHTDNTGFLYKFSYFAKKAEFRPQGLRVLCQRGSIFSGNLSNNNDYDYFKIFIKDLMYDVEVIRSDNEVNHKETSWSSGKNYQELKTIQCEVLGNLIKWENPFLGTGFNDQEIAMATLFMNSSKFLSEGKRLLVPSNEAFKDNQICNKIMSF